MRSDSGLDHPGSVPGEADIDGRERRALWGWVAVVELVLAAVAVLANLVIPSLVILALMLVSLAVRRRGLSSLGLHRVNHVPSVAVWMFTAPAAWTLLDAGLLKPIQAHLLGIRQDMSQFESLQGDVVLLLGWLALAWLLAGVGETVAFIGYVQTRAREVAGRLGAGSTLSAVVGSVVASVLLGLLHTEYGLIGVTISTVDGLFYCLLRYRCRTLWAPILAHGFTDTIGLVTVFLVGPVYGLW
jgi:uncharacterized protein